MGSTASNKWSTTKVSICSLSHLVHLVTGELRASGRAYRYARAQFGPDLVAQFVLEFIRRKAAIEQPWMVFWPMLLCHRPLTETPAAASRGRTVPLFTEQCLRKKNATPPKPAWAIWDNTRAALGSRTLLESEGPLNTSEKLLEDDILGEGLRTAEVRAAAANSSKLAHSSANELRKKAKQYEKKKALSYKENKQVQLTAQMRSMAEYMDALVGCALGTIQQAGGADNTIVIFTDDVSRPAPHFAPAPASPALLHGRLVDAPVVPLCSMDLPSTG